MQIYDTKAKWDSCGPFKANPFIVGGAFMELIQRGVFFLPDPRMQETKTA